MNTNLTKIVFFVNELKIPIKLVGNEIINITQGSQLNPKKNLIPVFCFVFKFSIGFPLINIKGIDTIDNINNTIKNSNRIIL